MGHEIYNFGIPFLGHHYYILSLSEPCLRVRRRFLRKLFFKLLIPKYPPWDGGYEIHNFVSPYPTEATYTKLSDSGDLQNRYVFTYILSISGIFLFIWRCYWGLQIHEFSSKS